MGFAFKRRLYEALPPAIKRPVAWIPFSFFAGRAYRETLARGERIRRASRAELLAYQEKELGKILGFAVAEVPAYEALRSTVERLSPFEALNAFPLVNKQMLQEDIQRYLPRSFASIPHFQVSTGGTSGSQLRFYLDDTSPSVELGFLHRMWDSVGYRPRCRRATFRGSEFPGASRGIYWQYNPIHNEIRFSPFHMTDENLEGYVRRMLAFRVSFLSGYPSALSILANYVGRASVDLGPLNLRATLLGSEAVYPDQREAIESFLGCRAFSWYGHSERVVLAGECESSNVYHSFPDYGVLEFIDEDGNVVEREGETGELTGTGLINRSLPLIRYQTEDMARRLPHHCECGRNFDRLDQVEGRWKQEYIIGKSGARISPTALNMHGDIFEHVTRYQYYQRHKGKLELRIMADKGFAEQDRIGLLEAYARKVGVELAIETRLVDDIPLTARGKLRRLIQEIPGEAE